MENQNPMSRGAQLRRDRFMEIKDSEEAQLFEAQDGFTPDEIRMAEKISAEIQKSISARDNSETIAEIKSTPKKQEKAAEEVALKNEEKVAEDLTESEILEVMNEINSESDSPENSDPDDEGIFDLMDEDGAKMGESIEVDSGGYSDEEMEELMNGL